jgi:hypothetical protein
MLHRGRTMSTTMVITRDTRNYQQDTHTAPQKKPSPKAIRRSLIKSKGSYFRGLLHNFRNPLT